MCGHGPKISRSRLSIFYFHRTNSPNPWRPDLKENEAVGAAIWQNHLSHFVWFYRNFCFPSRFFKPRWSIAFFSCTRVSQVGNNTLRSFKIPFCLILAAQWEARFAKQINRETKCTRPILRQKFCLSSSARTFKGPTDSLLRDPESNYLHEIMGDSVMIE